MSYSLDIILYRALLFGALLAISESFNELLFIVIGN
jgi:hypothetical protein